MDSTCPRESGRISSSTWVHLLRGLLLWSKFMSWLLFHFIHVLTVLIWFWNKLFTASVFCLFGLNVNIFAKPGFCDCSEGTQTPNPATKLETGKKECHDFCFFLSSPFWWNSHSKCGCVCFSLEIQPPAWDTSFSSSQKGFLAVNESHPNKINFRYCD